MSPCHPAAPPSPGGEGPHPVTGAAITGAPDSPASPVVGPREAAGRRGAGRAHGEREAAELLGRTAIIVVNYDSAPLLERNLAHVARQAPEARVVVVDNHSTTQARSELIALAGREGWSTVLPADNTGFGGGMNLGAQRAAALGAEILVLLNPDALIERDGLARLASRAAQDPGTLVGPVIQDPGGRTVSDGHVVCLADGSMRSRRSPRPIPPGGTRPWLSGACLALSAALFAQAGGFDARYFLYWEDVDFSARVLACGGRLAVERGAVAIHDEGATHAEAHQGERARSDTYYYYNIRNRLLYAGLHLSGPARRRWVATAAAAAREVVLRGGRRQLLSSPRPALTALAATRDGLGLMRAAGRGALPDPDTPLIR
ncbi:glycosyltransferase family 2 protein [Actinomyces bowdenii]|uniref:glycosyltransferase family 2 protein n=1 Tax=Actinomyces bowdenii TaxID=131109 RepID=UPI00214BAEC6|nr:glycosyltransferase family 2 protein [Actinomyces bowdenii]MCR2053020.1 glycosyltransferase family 2 protein [Actinomyces bowdenii]